MYLLTLLPCLNSLCRITIRTMDTKHKRMRKKNKRRPLEEQEEHQFKEVLHRNKRLSIMKISNLINSKNNPQSSNSHKKVLPSKDSKTLLLSIPKFKTRSITSTSKK